MQEQELSLIRLFEEERPRVHCALERAVELLPAPVREQHPREPPPPAARREQHRSGNQQFLPADNRRGEHTGRRQSGRRRNYKLDVGSGEAMCLFRGG